jgi:trans-2-enoyl-CoA reductase
MFWKHHRGLIAPGIQSNFPAGIKTLILQKIRFRNQAVLVSNPKGVLILDTTAGEMGIVLPV